MRFVLLLEMILCSPFAEKSIFFAQALTPRLMTTDSPVKELGSARLCWIWN
jgi:hypothetical protein